MTPNNQMPINSALQIVKQTIDQAIKMGICHNIEATETVAMAWRVIVGTLQNLTQKTGSGNDSQPAK